VSTVEGRAVDYQGRGFVIPTATVAVDPGERLALATITGAAYHFGDDRLRYDMTEDAVDLSLVRTGRCPLLGEHIHHLSGLLGRVEAAAVEDGELKALVRFARTPAASEVWSLVEQGFPISLSAGGTVEAASRCPATWRGGR
jgi:hypothetical protein